VAEAIHQTRGVQVSTTSIANIFRGATWGYQTGVRQTATSYRETRGAIRRGPKPRGMRKLSDADIATIMALKDTHLSCQHIAEIMHRTRDVQVSRGTIENIFRGTTWGSLTGARKPTTSLAVIRGTHRRGEQNHKHKLTSADVLEIVAQAQSGASYAALGRRFHVSDQSIRDILRGKNYGWLTGLPRLKAPPRQPAEAPHPDDALVWQHWRGGQASGTRPHA
jgi:hypothetical protein